MEQCLTTYLGIVLAAFLLIGVCLDCQAAAFYQSKSKQRFVCPSVPETYMFLVVGCAESGRSGGWWRRQAGKNTQARLLLAKGCENCPTSDDVWLENARVQASSDNAKAVLARGVAAIPNSIKIWLQVDTQQLWLYNFCRATGTFGMVNLGCITICM